MIWVAVMAIAVAGCGSSSSSNANQPKPTGLKKRVWISNVQSNTLNLLDAQKDTFTTKNIGVPSATKLVTGGGITIATDSSGSQITIIDNATEAVTFNAPIGDIPFDIAITPDGKTAWTAQRDFGFVQSVDTATGVANPVIRIPNARTLAMSPKGTKLIVFSDTQTQAPPNTHTLFIVDTATGTFQTITDAAHLDQPFTAVFGTSDTQAFILNCGAECGGTAASVVSLDFSGAAPVFSAPIPVAAATAGLLNGANLYVAGTPVPAIAGPSAGCPLSSCGALTVINTTALTAGAAIPITDGRHQKMAFANNRVYIASAGCTTDPGAAANTVRGCLSIFNTSNSTVKFPEESSFRQNFDVTGLQPISGRNVIYIVQGGELDILDTNTDALAANITQLDIVGKAMDAVLIDP
jgi:DNA-binding beta-propeller fold protein YncE